jgi:hypothetical protein
MSAGNTHKNSKRKVTPGREGCTTSKTRRLFSSKTFNSSCSSADFARRSFVRKDRKQKTATKGICEDKSQRQDQEQDQDQGRDQDQDQDQVKDKGKKPRGKGVYKGKQGKDKDKRRGIRHRNNKNKKPGKVQKVHSKEHTRHGS